MRTDADGKRIRAINKSVKKLCKKGCLSGETIVVFGCSVWAVHLKTALNKNGYEIDAFVDNNPSKINEMFLETAVYAPYEYLPGREEKTVVLICAAAYEEISRQVESLGYPPDIRQFIVGFGVTKAIRRKKKSTRTGLLDFASQSLRATYNYLFYKWFRNKYGENKTIFVTPFGASGDVYLSGLYFRPYLERHNINDYLFVVPGKLAEKTARIFQVKNIICLDRKVTRKLLWALQLFGTESGIKPLFSGAIRISGCIPSNTKCELHHTFLDALKYDAYELDRDVAAAEPCFVNDVGLIENLFAQNNLIKGRTVILSPYVGTFDPGIPSIFWENLVYALQQEGYCVCTNSAGEHEPSIGGTKAIFFDLINAVPVVEAAGYFVGQRSGLCDIISSAKCKMTVIYEPGIRTNRLDYFGLRNMGLNDTVNELSYQFENYKGLIEIIISSLQTENK